MERFLLELADLMAKHKASLGFDTEQMVANFTTRGSGVTAMIERESVSFYELGRWTIDHEDVRDKVKQMMKKD